MKQSYMITGMIIRWCFIVAPGRLVK